MSFLRKHDFVIISTSNYLREKLIAFLKSIFKELQKEPQLDYGMALNSRRTHLFFKTKNRNRNPDIRGICNHNRHFKNRNQKSNSASNLIFSADSAQYPKIRFRLTDPSLFFHFQPVKCTDQIIIIIFFYILGIQRFW